MCVIRSRDPGDPGDPGNPFDIAFPGISWHSFLEKALAGALDKAAGCQM